MNIFLIALFIWIVEVVIYYANERRKGFWFLFPRRHSNTQGFTPWWGNDKFDEYGMTISHGPWTINWWKVKNRVSKSLLLYLILFAISLDIVLVIKGVISLL